MLNRLILLCAIALFFTQRVVAVNIVLDGTQELISGEECKTATYRFGTLSKYQDQDIDLILEVTNEDNDYLHNKCVDIVNNVVSFRLKDEDRGDNIAYMNFKLTVVKKGTLVPLVVDRIYVTNFDLDNNPLYTDSDDVYYKEPSKVYLSEYTNVTASHGSFYNKYTLKLKGQTSGNCNDDATLLEKECRAGVSFDNTSTFYARVQNDNAYGTINGYYYDVFRLIQFSFEIKDLTPLMSETEINCGDTLNLSTQANSWIESQNHTRYSNNIDISKRIKIKNSNGIKVTIDGESEENFDWLYIYDENGNEIFIGSGIFNNREIRVSGSEIKIRFTSDSSIAKSGLTIKVEGENCQNEPIVSIQDAISILEGDSGDRNISINIMLDSPPSKEVIIQTQPFNITALEGEDYTRVTDRVVFNIGEIQKSVKYKIHGDTKVEDNETFEVRLLNPQNAKIDINRSKTIVTIINDDEEPPNLVSEYRFDECRWSGNSSEVIDSIGERRGEINGVNTTTDGKINRGAKFSGDRDYLLFHGFDDIFGKSSNEFTITAWIKPNALRDTKTNHYTKNTIFAKASDRYNDNLEIGINPDGTLHLYLDTDKKDKFADFGSSGDIDINSWHFIAISYKRGRVEVSIDNKRYINSSTWFGANYLDGAKNSPFTIGASIHIDNFFNGLIDEVKIFSNALSFNQISTIYANESVGKNWNGTIRDKQKECSLLPIGCIESAFMFQNRPTDINILNLTDGVMNLLKSGVSVDNINALGFNKKDGYFWGYNYTKQNGTITKIGYDENGNWSSEDFLISGLDNFASYVGDIDNSGHLYLKERGSGTRVVVIDLDPNSTTYLTKIRDFNLKFSINTADWGFNPKDNLLYAVNNGSANKYLYKIDPQTGELISKQNTMLTNNRGFGASFFDADGFYYIYDNYSGEIFRIDVASSAEAVLFAKGAVVNYNDGAMCTNTKFKFDFGDLPSKYSTKLENNGARHSLPTYQTPSIYLGSSVTNESDGKPSIGANLDDGDDGIRVLNRTLQDKQIEAGKSYTLNIECAGAGYLNGWIDFNGDGDFNDSKEHIADNVFCSGGNLNLDISIPNSSKDITTYARFRYSTQKDLSPFGVAEDGEVEDYRVYIKGNLEPLECRDRFYLSNRGELGFESEDSGATWLHTFNALSPAFVRVGNGFVSSNGGYNALGYNSVDNFLYALYGNELLKIDKNGNIKNLGEVEGLRDVQLYAGAFDRDGYYYVTGDGNYSTTIYKIDIFQRKVIKSINFRDTKGKAVAVKFWDMAIDNTNNYFYAMLLRDSNNTFINDKFVKINKDNGVISIVGKDYSSVSYISLIYVDKNNKIVVVPNDGGLYEIDKDSGKIYFLNASASLNYYNDGANCPDTIFTLPPHIPRLSIGDVIKAEGDSGETNFEFKVSIDASLPFIPIGTPAFFYYKVVDGDGNIVSPPRGIATTADMDYKKESGIAMNMDIFSKNRTQTITVTVYGDTKVEPDEEFYVDIYFPEFFPKNLCMLGKSRGVGVILNDDMKFKIIRPDGDLNSSSLYTQVANRDFDYSIISYTNQQLSKLENITLKIELIDNITNSPLYIGYKYIDSATKFDVLDSSDLALSKVTRDASFKVSFLKDVNGSIAHGNYASKEAYNALLSKGYIQVTQEASDHFAIRPAGFKILIGDNNGTIIYRDNTLNWTNPLELIAGHNYYIEARAVDKNGTLVRRYTTNSNELNATLIFKDNPNCKVTQNFQKNYNFIDGILKGEVSNREIGEYGLYFKDNLWSQIDSLNGDCIRDSYTIPEDKNAKVGCDIVSNAIYKNLDLKFNPSKFKVNSYIKNIPKTNRDYIYMSDLSKSLDMGLSIVADIEAQNELGDRVKNFTKSCRAEDLYLKLKFNIQTDENSSNRDIPIKTVNGSLVNFKRVVSFNGLSPDILDVVDTNLSDRVSIPSSRFLDEREGNSSVEILLNLARLNSEPINPIEIKFDTLEINSSIKSKVKNYEHSANGATNIGISKKLYYATIAPDRENYGDEYEGYIKTPINALIYCKKTISWCSQKIGSNGINNDKTIYGWYRAIEHNSSIDGKVNSFIVSNPLCEVNPKANRLPNFNEGVEGRIDNITTGYSGNSYPAKVVVDLNVSEWLKYHKDKSRDGVAFWKVTFRDKNATLSGVGESGNQVDIKTTTRPAKKISW